MKAENESYRKKLRKAEKQIAKLKKGLRGTDSESLENSEITQLRFDREALEKKLRKYASHCQHLENERANIVHVLHTTKIDDIERNDLSKSIISLCDKVASLEEECESFSKAGNSTSCSVAETEKLRQKNRLLLTQIDDLRKNAERLQKSEYSLSEEIASLRLQQEELQGKAAKAISSHEGVSNEMILEKIRFLERENLQLHKDLQTTKKKLQGARSEINMLRLQDSDDTTLEITALKGRLTSKASGDAKAAMEKLRSPLGKKGNVGTVAPKRVAKVEAFDVTRTPGVVTSRSEKLNKENEDMGIPKDLIPKTENRFEIGEGQVPGLGEALPMNEENTPECTQS